MKSKDIDTYTIIFLGEKSITDDISDCMVLSCSNKNTLEQLTGISMNRIVYIFTKLQRKSLHENNIFIIKSERFYKGAQPGGIRNKAIHQRGNDY